MSKIKEQVVQELHRLARKKFPRRRFIIKGFDETWQADLADFSFFARENKGYKFMLVVIDIYSKYLWIEPLKDKSGINVTIAMKTILEKDKRTPDNLQTDAGKEFYNKEFKNLMLKFKINHYSTFSVMKAAIAERVIRTIKERVYRMFSLKGKYVWYDNIQEITQQYNQTKHSTIKRRPCDINKHTSLAHVYSNIKICGKRKYKIGDIVRISKHKTVFEKGYTPNWTTELFKISHIKITNPSTYMLEDMQGVPIKGSFYDLELQEAKHPDVYFVEKILRRKGSKVFVKWLGFDSSHNSWIDKKNSV